jgi:hypothetical protein|tara:strand:+ start:1143 stop:2060 length:918 start_codon:yes stop_codon:yes gene_type:complete
MKNKKKILIVGCGNMGTAHLTSFLKAKSKYHITVIDKISTINKLKRKFSDNFLQFQDKLPKKKSFDLAVIATGSKERFLVSSIIIKNNSIKKILLEKFIFLKKIDYVKFDTLLNSKKIKCYVNCWGTTLSRLLNFPKMINEKTTINVTINTGEYLTNLIHILNLIFDSIGFKKVNNCKLTIDKVLKSKVKGYNEILGKLSFCTINRNIYVNISSKKMKNIFKIENKTQTKKKSQIYLNNKLKLIKQYNKKLKKFDFPLSSVYTEKIYKNINSTKYPYKFIDYEYAKKLSLLILNLISKNKNLSIR